MERTVQQQQPVKAVSKLKWAYIARTSLRAVNGLITLFFFGLSGYFIYQQYLSLPRINLYQLTNASVSIAVAAALFLITQIVKYGFKGNPYWFKQLAIAVGIFAVLFGMPGLANGVLVTVKALFVLYF